jgi:hypothetical protein
MESDKLEIFFSSACNAFPGLRDLLAASPATLAVWSQTLQQVSYTEAAQVLDWWIRGTLENPPVGFRRELFALDVRAVAMRIRSDDMRLQEQQERLQKLDRRRRPSQAFRSIAKPFYEILALRAKVMAGELSATECDQQVKAIIDGAFV